MATRDGTAPQRWTAVAALVALGGWYLLVGRRAVHYENARLGRRYLVLAVPLTLLAFALDPVGAIMLFMLYPHIWVLLPQRQATVVTALTAVTTGVAIALGSGFEPSSVFVVSAFSVVALAFAAAMGLWITRIVEQSRQRAELVTRLNAAQTELAEAAKQAGISAERERLARDIHDTLAQGFSAVALLIDAAKADLGHGDDRVRHLLTRAGDVARENLDEARTLVHALTPPSLREGSVSDVLHRLVDRLNDGSATAFTFTVTGDPRSFPPAREVAVLRLVQEATGNARAHADASGVTVQLVFGSTETLVRVSDNGRGFDVDTAAGGYGLAGMRRRVTDTGGSLTVDSVVGNGTTVTARWPHDD